MAFLEVKIKIVSVHLNCIGKEFDVFSIGTAFRKFKLKVVSAD